jgi:hypothetical protein
MKTMISPAILGTGHHRAEIQRHQLLVLERFGYVGIDDAQCQSLGDGGLADAGLADQHGVVLGAPRQHLDGAADFLVATDHRIELALAGRLGEVARVFFERVVAALGRRGIGRAALAQLRDRLFERLRLHARLGQRFRGVGPFGQRQGHQHALDSDE